MENAIGSRWVGCCDSSCSVTEKVCSASLSLVDSERKFSLKVNKGAGEERLAKSGQEAAAAKSG